MPHRAGYFVLASQWDHHCQALFESLKAKLQHVEWEIGEMEHQNTWDCESLTNYYKKWHYNNELYQEIFSEIESRQSTVSTLSQRGYGVNIELSRALDFLKQKYQASLAERLKNCFFKHSDYVKATIYVSKEIEEAGSEYIITELCKKLNWQPDENIPNAVYPVKMDLDHYLFVMEKETAWSTNTAIFQKMFLTLGCSSMSIMKGSMGHQDTLSPQELKRIANKNFLEMYHETFDHLHEFTGIDMAFLQHIHWVLSKGLDNRAGNFRTSDFRDKNGVTFEYDNFHTELQYLDSILKKTGQSFHNLFDFIYHLCLVYYWFIAIHPFSDSNGRVGKCFINYMLLKKGIAPIWFRDEEEIFALPRYGGTVKMMHDYIQKRINLSVDHYFYEMWKLEHFGFLSSQIHNVSFDSGFYFRQINNNGNEQLEVNFRTFLIEDSNPLCAQYQEQCRVVFPDEHFIYHMHVHCGFSFEQDGPWEHIFTSHKDFYIMEMQPEPGGIRNFDVFILIELNDVLKEYSYFNCCVLSEDGSRTFNNKGLNYIYKMEKQSYD